jgi:hypothetical protein
MAATTVFVVLESFAESGSTLVVDTVAVFVIAVPMAVPEGTWTTSVKVALAPFAKEASEHVTVPVPPTAGLEHVNAGPVFCASETNVVPEGTVSVSVALAAASGPPFATLIEYEMSAFASVVAGPDFVTDMSAPPATSVVAEPELFSAFGSSLLITLATLVTKVPGGVAEGTWTVNVKLALAPATKVASVHVAALGYTEPTAGFVHVNAGPVFCTSETNVVPEGTTSDRVTLVASFGPRLVTVMEYATSALTGVVAGPDLLTVKSAGVWACAGPASAKPNAASAPIVTRARRARSKLSSPWPE